MRIISVLIITILFASCKKEQLDPALPIVGKWAMSDVVLYSNKDPLLLINSNMKIVKFKYITVDITSNGKLIYDSKFGKETFRIIKNEKINYKVDYELNVSPIYEIQGHIFTVKNWKGKTFKFKFFYDPVINRLIGVAWYKGISYNTFDRPVAGGVHYEQSLYTDGWNYSYSDAKIWNYEFLGVFEKN